MALLTLPQKLVDLGAAPVGREAMLPVAKLDPLKLTALPNWPAEKPGDPLPVRLLPLAGR